MSLYWDGLAYWMDGWMDGWMILVRSSYLSEKRIFPWLATDGSLFFFFFGLCLWLWFWAELWLWPSHLYRHPFCLLLSSLSMTTTPSIWISTPSKLENIFEKLNIKVFRLPFVHRKVKVYWDPPQLVEPNLSHRSLHRPPPPVPKPNFHCVACDCTFHSTQDMASHRCPPYHNAQKSLQRCWKKVFAPRLFVSYRMVGSSLPNQSKINIMYLVFSLSIWERMVV